MDALEEHTIPFISLKDGPHEYHFELGPEFFEAAREEDFEGGRISVDVRLDKGPTMLIANIHMEGPVALRCDHCNGPLELPVVGDQRQIFQLHTEEEFDDEELTSLDPGAHSLNLTHYLYECLRLGLPARRVHTPGGCDPEVVKALDNLSTTHEPVPDPRWDALNQIKNPRP